MNKSIFINGRYCSEKEAMISVFDHGLLYGDGVFEGIRVYHGKVFKLKEHVQRLFDSAHYISLKIDYSKEEACRVIQETVEKNGLREGYVRVIVTRGLGTLGLNPYICTEGSFIVIADTITLYPEEYYRNGLSIVTVSTKRVSPDALSASVKSLNYLNNIFAKMQSIKAGAEEALMLNHEGYVAECAGDNIFTVRDGLLSTPGTNCGILNGITRKIVIDIARQKGIDVFEGNLTLYDVYTADECFLTGTAAEIVPVRTVDNRPMGKEVPGPLTRMFIDEFKRTIREEA